MANVFISHRGADTLLATQLSNEVKAAGHYVWLDEWEINIGDSIVGKMNEGLSGSTYVILCYSSLDATSPYMSREWLSALARQMNGQGIKILPIRLSGDKAPAILEDLKYADLMADWSQGLAQLLAAIR